MSSRSSVARRARGGGDSASKRPAGFGYEPASVKTLAAVLALLPFVPFVAAETSFAVGTARAERGHSATGFLEVPAGVDAATSIPVVVVQGARPGPVLAIVSGAHGTEYASIVAVEKLI